MIKLFYLLVASSATCYGILSLTSRSKVIRVSRSPVRVRDSISVNKSSFRFLDKADLDALKGLIHAPKFYAVVVIEAVTSVLLPPLVAFSLVTSGLILLWSWLKEQEIGVSETLQDLWPTILQEMSIRVASTGSSIARTFFDSTRSLDTHLQHLFDQAEAIWTLTSDLETALRYLERELSDSNSQNVLRSILLCERSGTHHAHERLGQLHLEQQRQYDSTKDLKTRLASVAVARYFVVVVPLVMFGLGAFLSGSLNLFTSSLSQLIFGVSLLVLVICWVWTTRLMVPPQVGYRVRPSLSKGQRVAVEVALQAERRRSR